MKNLTILVYIILFSIITSVTNCSMEDFDDSYDTDYDYSDDETEKEIFNHPTNLLGHWSGRHEDESYYCSFYYNVSFYDDDFGWLQKARYKDPIPTIQPCSYGIDYSYGDMGYYYLDWTVKDGQLCSKLYDNSVSKWDCDDYSISGNELIWDIYTYRRID